jgi:hypothetical protein
MYKHLFRCLSCEEVLISDHCEEDTAQAEYLRFLIELSGAIEDLGVDIVWGAAHILKFLYIIHFCRQTEIYNAYFRS